MRNTPFFMKMNDIQLRKLSLNTPRIEEVKHQYEIINSKHIGAIPT